jgi:hypothetical protein
LEEYGQLLRSWFFSWPAGGSLPLARALLLSWLLVLPVALLVAGGSITLRHEPLRLTMAAATAAALLPLLLLSRQWLGWTYVRQRLVAETVAYEESGWYDGQEWEKPIAWRQQDLLVARFQIDPLMRRLRRGAALVAGLLLAGATLCQAL